MPDRPDVGAGDELAQRTPEPSCPNCAALRHSSRLLADSALFLIDRNAELSRQLAAYHDRDRHGAEMLLGLAGLQRAAV